MKRIVIYDNEPEQCSALAAILRRLCRDAVVFEVTEYSKAMELSDMDLYAAFFDIELENGLNGIELAAGLHKDHPDTAIVFVTAHMRYCEQVFEASPDAMLIKPYTDKSVKRALSIIERRHSDSGVISIAVSKNSAQTIKLDEVSYFESELRKVKAYDLKYNEMGTYREIKLSELYERLPDKFVWCHQSFVVNLACVTGISRYSLTLKGGTTIPISQSRFKDVRRRYIEYVGDSL